MGDEKKFKILIICYYFPPYNVAGSLRIGRIAEHLVEFGHDVRIIAADNVSSDKSISSNIENKVIYVNWFDINTLPKKIVGGSNKAESITQSDKKYLSFKERILLYFSKIYKNLTNIPDGKIFFIRSVKRAAKELKKEWQPDIIYASALPASVAIAGNKVSKIFNVPWICEFRDLWTTNHYYNFPKWRQKIDSWIELKTLQTSSGFVTVSEPLAEDIRYRFKKKKTEVILNGADYDVTQKLFSKLQSSKNNSSAFSNKLEIVYTGSLYKGKRDPSIIFEAIKKTKKHYPHEHQINIHFYGNDNELFINDLAIKYNVKDNVFCHGNIPYEESLEVQMRADLLLLLLWVDETEIGVYTGKFFEYIAARRPIVAIGHSNNVAIKMINERSLGYGTSNAENLYNRLVEYLILKKNGFIPDLSAKSLDGLTRKDQSRLLEKFLLKSLKS